eukprot:886231-Pyramimonas_sp.AAC.1
MGDVSQGGGGAWRRRSCLDSSSDDGVPGCEREAEAGGDGRRQGRPSVERSSVGGVVGGRGRGAKRLAGAGGAVGATT